MMMTWGRAVIGIPGVYPTRTGGEDEPASGFKVTVGSGAGVVMRSAESGRQSPIAVGSACQVRRRLAFAAAAYLAAPAAPRNFKQVEDSVTQRKTCAIEVPSR